MDVRMAMLSSGGELGSSGVAPMTLSLVEGPESIMEGRARGSAKSEDEFNTLLNFKKRTARQFKPSQEASFSKIQIFLFF